MSLSVSIFQKACPGCAASVATSATRCRCGHVFESGASNLSPLEASLRDEELYEDYLAARAEQARQAARTAEVAMFDDTANAGLVSACALAREVAKSIDSDLAEQRNKIAALRNALRDAGTAGSPAAAKPSSIAQKPASSQSRVMPSGPARPAPAVAVSPARADLKKTPPAAAAAPVWHAATSQKAAGVLTALKNAKAREAIAHARQAKAAAAAKQAPVPAAGAHGAAPPSAFRQEQASRAERIMEAQQTVDGKECPNCTSSVPVNTTRCRCGFAFVSASTELPSLTLCTGDFTALRNSLKNNQR